MNHNTGRLRQLHHLGQSPWYDNIDRRLIDGGELKGLIDRGIMGVTSNPSIFEKSIGSSDVYDEKIRRLKAAGKDLYAIYDELTADDVRDAAGLLMGVYEKTRGADGYVSIEVLPEYAHDSYKTIEYARYIYDKVGRKNIMIKVPGTGLSPEAIRALIADGISVNVTLIFSQEQYELASQAYQDGLRDRMRRGEDIQHVSSVASIFVSRIDTKVDGLLDVFIGREMDLEKKAAMESLKGKIAIANCKLIYQRFKQLFADDRFGDIKAKGGRIQRPLWASTSTKNPAYSDCLYVDNLIGHDTVNTLPHQTVLAYEDHGRLGFTLEDDLEGAVVLRAEIEQCGINLDMVCREAQNEGLKAFENSFRSLLDTLKKKIG
ncbi:MAG: transaldolase [Candidatus Omnitrophica bacterium]|nr:transaldolase [Candidatus Omnitrophota bacterium]MDD5574646.1 transaldolase [Candidatus Omnitrophota bacterium]